MKKGFTLIELLAVIVILAVIALIATPLVLNVIDESKAKTFDVEAASIEQAAEYYLTSGLRMENIPKYEEYYIPVSELTSHIKKLKNDMLSEYVIVKKTDKGISYYYTGRDRNPYLKNKTIKEAVESDTTHIRENVKVNGVTVNKVIGTKGEKGSIKNWVWYSGQLWQVLETTNEYVKLITANSVTGLTYGPDNEWETSWVRKWLNEIDSESNQDGIYYNNLSRIDLLLDGRFCLDEPANIVEEELASQGVIKNKLVSFTPINNCSNIVTDKIGLMTFEDFVYSLDGTVSGITGNSYIDENEMSWTMTKYSLAETQTQSWFTYNSTPSRIVHEYYKTNDFGKGVRPVIYISSSVKIEKNNATNYGTINNPYRLIGEQITKTGNSLNGVTVGSYIYLSEENNPYDSAIELVTSKLSYDYNKTKVRYRVIGISDNGNIKVQRSDVLRGLPDTISIKNGVYIPYYYRYDEINIENSCMHVSGTWYSDGCVNQNYFKPNYGSGEFNYTESENVAFYLNNASNSFYNWLSNKVRENIITTNWALTVSAYGRDYTRSLYYAPSTYEYPKSGEDGFALAKIGLPNWGDMFSGNDLYESYWYINRWIGSSNSVTYMPRDGRTTGINVSCDIVAIRPVFYLKPIIKITGGEGTPNNPYTLSIN